MTVKRFAATHDNHGVFGDNNGEYVLHSDYAKLEAQVKQLTIDVACYKRGMEASNERLVQVVAENVSLKKFALELYFPDGTSRVQEEDIPCTDSTDAILTSLRAEGMKGVK